MSAAPEGLLRVSGLLCLLLASLLTAKGAAPVPRLQQLIDQTPEQGEIILPQGTWKEPVRITRPLRLKGLSPEASVIDVTADEPALRLNSRGAVVLESLTIRWQRATIERSAEALAAISAKDTALTLRGVQFQAPSTMARSPCALNAAGFSEVKIEQCRFDGFEFTVRFSGGARGLVADSIFWMPGHAGVTVGPGCAAEVVRCLVARSAFHGIRCTGGRLEAFDNLVIGNKNRGFYLGNRSATGLIRNNIIFENGTGISGFAQSEVEVAHNLIAKSDYSGLDARDSCRLHVHGNVFLDNKRALMLFAEGGGGDNKNVVQTNLLWGNQTEAENFDPTPKVVRVEPKFKDVARGDFAAADPSLHQGHGLQDAGVLKTIWAKWSALVEQRR